jgi:hypothetical protein
VVTGACELHLVAGGGVAPSHGALDVGATREWGRASRSPIQ